MKARLVPANEFGKVIEEILSTSRLGPAWPEYNWKGVSKLQIEDLHAKLGRIAYEAEHKRQAEQAKAMTT